MRGMLAMVVTAAQGWDGRDPVCAGSGDAGALDGGEFRALPRNGLPPEQPDP
ncbi:MAG: hypothetical protein KIT14_15920 [bacterium]|nr:hypothetical protein [bacterium]